MPLSRKIAMLIYKGTTTLPEVVSLLTKYKLLALLPSIKQSLVKLALFEGKSETIMIESPFPLNDASVTKIKKIIGNDVAEYEVTINKSVLAGFKATFKGTLFDGSAERIIKQLTSR